MNAPSPVTVVRTMTPSSKRQLQLSPISKMKPLANDSVVHVDDDDDAINVNGGSSAATVPPLMRRRRINDDDDDVESERRHDSSCPEDSDENFAVILHPNRDIKEQPACQRLPAIAETEEVTASKRCKRNIKSRNPRRHARQTKTSKEPVCSNDECQCYL